MCTIEEGVMACVLKGEGAMTCVLKGGHDLCTKGGALPVY